MTLTDKQLAASPDRPMTAIDKLLLEIVGRPIKTKALRGLSREELILILQRLGHIGEPPVGTELLRVVLAKARHAAYMRTITARIEAFNATR